MRHLTFEIPGPPVPKGRPRVTRRGTFTPQKTKDYEQAVGEAAMVAARRIEFEMLTVVNGILADFPVAWPTDAKYSVECDFYFKKNPACDGDNCLKAVQDGLEKVLYANDKQVVMGSYVMHKGSSWDVTRVTVTVLDDWK